MIYGFQRFDSPEDYADYLRNCREDVGIHDPRWAGGSLSHGIDKLINGDTIRLAQAQAILDKLDLAAVFSNDIPVLEPCIAGFAANVPAAIAGHPQAMFHRGFVESPSVMAPLSVYVETTVSAGVTQDQLVKRGVAVLAFCLAMELVRPVDLYCVSLISHDSRPGVWGAVTKIQSRPMDIGRAVWMLTDPNYARRCLFTGATQQHGKQLDRGPWCFNSNPSADGYVANMRDILGMDADDVFMKGGYLFDTLMLNDPVAWVRKMIEQHSNKQGE